MTDEEVAALLDCYRESGGNFLDTAHVYAFWTSAGAGSSERAIARYKKTRDTTDLVVATKGGHPGASGYRKVESWLAPHRVRADIEDSLGRLEVDCLDLFYLHRDDTRWSVAEIIELLNGEIAAGRVRAIGASNWTIERLAQANAYAREHGLHGFVVSQIQWSLAHKDTPPPKAHGAQTVYAQSADIAFHERTELALAPFSATAKGYFAAEDKRREDYDNPISRARRRRAAELSSRKGCTPTQIALAWLLGQQFPCFPITGTRSVEHLRENIAATDCRLTPEEVAWLSQ